MYEYVHGGDIFNDSGSVNSEVVDFSANINPLGLPKEIQVASRDAVEASYIYPDSDNRYLTSLLGEYEGIDKTRIFCSNGASDILFRLTYAVKPKKILVTAPSFADYERAGRAAGAEITYYSPENDFNVDESITKIILSESFDIVFICNPNNPTGNLVSPDIMRKIASACQKANSFLLVDECFIDFVMDSDIYSSKCLIDTFDRLIILKAFTKIYAMPGLRLGYCMCSDRMLIDRMRFHGPDWAVSNIAQTAGAAALKLGKEYIYNSAVYVKAEREYLSEALEKLDFKVFPAQANFILFYCHPDIDLRDELRKKGVLIRDCSNFKGLAKGYYRTAVLTRDKNKKLIKSISEVMTSWQSL